MSSEKEVEAGEKDEDDDLMTLMVELDGVTARVDLISMVRSGSNDERGGS